MGIWTYAEKNMPKWGIPGKSIKNAAQRRFFGIHTLRYLMAKIRTNAEMHIFGHPVHEFSFQLSLS